MRKQFSPQTSVPRHILFSGLDEAQKALEAAGQFYRTQLRFSALQQHSEDSKSYSLGNHSHMQSSELAEETSTL